MSGCNPQIQSKCDAAKESGGSDDYVERGCGCAHCPQAPTEQAPERLKAGRISELRTFAFLSKSGTVPIGWHQCDLAWFGTFTGAILIIPYLAILGPPQSLLIVVRSTCAMGSLL